MPTRERHQRGQGEQLRGQLIRAATELLVTPGPPFALSLRAIARACGVAPSAVYLHFDSQTALLNAVIEAQFAHLRTALDAGDDAAAGPQVRLVAMATAYLRWALHHPGAYQLLFEQPDVVADPARGPGLDLLERAARLLTAQGVGDGPARERSVRLWCALHGLASLRIHKPDAPWTSSPDVDATALVDAVAGTPVGPP